MNARERLTVGEVTARTGLSRKALRLYEQAELVVPSRSEAGYRLYDADALRRLQLIRRARSLNMHLAELGEFLDIAEGCCDRSHEELTALVAAKLQETERRVGELQELRRTLQATLQRLEHDAVVAREGQVHRCEELLCTCQTT